ncbi:MAG: UUP1 family membrane protein [Alphaproteobacteria bacterium]|nr:UUP1 family membrane protein [Alphaproteobacteria bacterium]
MTRTWITICIALGLILFGLGVFYYKAVMLSYPITPSQTVDSWYIEFSSNIEPKSRRNKDALEFALAKPRDNENYVVTNLQMFAPEFGVEDDSNARYEFTKRSLVGSETILLRFNIFAIDNPTPIKSADVKIDDQYRKKNRISNPDDKIVILYEKIDEIIKEAKDKSAGPVSYTKQIIKILDQDKSSQRFLIEEMGVSSREAMIVKLLGASDVKARIAHGFELQDRNNNLDIVTWVEVNDGKAWKRVAVSPAMSSLENYYLWWVGDHDVFNNAESVRYSYTLSSKANRDGSLTREIWMQENRNPVLNFFSLQTLPLEQQFVVQILVLIPLGALLVSFFRQMIGFQTFGTFMPVLIALAFRETGLGYGIAFFFGIICVGLIARAYITKLHLLMVPRLSAVLSTIVLFIILMMLVTKDMDISLGISVALFPVVIITMFIERMSTMLDEKGGLDAAYGFIGSMFVASVIYIFVLSGYTIHLMFVFPELIFVSIGLCLLLGRYNGYKLMEYWRFRQIKKATS